MAKKKLHTVIPDVSHNKKSKINAHTSVAKTAHANPRYWSLRPTWKFNEMDWNFDFLHKFWIKCERSSMPDGSPKPVFCVRELQENLKNIEILTWQEIFTNDNFGDHPIDLQDLKIKNPNAIRRLCELFPARMRDNSIVSICSIAIRKKKRLWGIIDPDTGVFSFLWWDPEHKIWEVEKK